MYERSTRNIRVAVKPAFLDDQSDPDEQRYLWSYTVTIENKGPETVQLLSRYWQITDGRGQVQEVRGPGVVGAQPVIAPGQKFQYTSGCPLPTASGSHVRPLSDAQQHRRSVRGGNSGLPAGKPARAAPNPLDVGRSLGGERG